MFKLVPKKYLDVQKDKIVNLYQSLNQPQISPGPDSTPEPAHAYFVLVEEKPDEFALFIGLYFTRSTERVFYSSDSFSPEQSPEKLAQAEAFAGEMGFMMDDTRFGELDDLDSREIMRTVPLFYRDIGAYMEALTTSEIQAMRSPDPKQNVASVQTNFLRQYVVMLSML